MYGQLLRFSTHWPIVAWWQVGPLSGVSCGADGPTIWKRLACPGVMRRPRPLSRSGTSTAAPPRRVRLRRRLPTTEPRRSFPGPSRFPVARTPRLREPVLRAQSCPPDLTLNTPLPFHQGLETTRAEHAIVLVDHSPGTRPRGQQPTRTISTGSPLTTEMLGSNAGKRPVPSAGA